MQVIFFVNNFYIRESGESDRSTRPGGPDQTG